MCSGSLYSPEIAYLVNERRAVNPQLFSQINKRPSSPMLPATSAPRAPTPPTQSAADSTIHSACAAFFVKTRVALTVPDGRAASLVVTGRPASPVPVDCAASSRRLRFDSELFSESGGSRVGLPDITEFLMTRSDPCLHGVDLGLGAREASRAARGANKLWPPRQRDALSLAIGHGQPLSSKHTLSSGPSLAHPALHLAYRVDPLRTMT